ncbi:PAS domain S-box-containing protein [Sphingomonas guangdongensis]|uniref:histidine kinase n=1 Tax=Sphingomonas guangdongensis TaxID=1141890 RepID=A0A285QD95_9SPHN|nr:ATP-binding protein [Sphingomonas guangdongensis]SOB79454.1 PAS domain S-box-containing protein [Sphingomonas guangdongensis]
MTQRDRRAELSESAPSLRRYLGIAALLPLVLAAALFFIRQEASRSEALRVQAAASYERRLEQVRLLSRLKDAETAQRGYLLTSDPAFLEPFEPARRDVAALLRRLDRQSLADVPATYRATVRALVTAKFKELDETIALARGGRAAAAQARVAAGIGKELMDRLRVEIGQRIVDEQRRSVSRTAAFEAQRARVIEIVWTLFALLSLVLLAFLVFLWRVRAQRYRANVAAFESAERNATILNSTVDAILILNPSGTVEIMNAAATHMLGYASDELERRDIATILDIAPGEGSFHKRVGLHDGQLAQSFLPDRRVIHRDGHDVAVDVAMGLMSLPSGDHLVVSLRDISERKRVERVKDDLMSTVSHELRTPLTSIVGALGLLRSGSAGTLPTSAGRLVEIAENNSRRLIRLINDMLDIDRIETGTLRMLREPIDLRLTIEQAGLGSQGLAGTRAIRVASHLPDQPVMVMGDADRLLQVMTNLMSNAIRAAPPGSKVDLFVENDDRDCAVVTVADRGPGVPAGFRDRIFGRFERAEQSDGTVGTGLGLAISREIVTRHDGRIWFEDRPGGGTCFRFTIPLTGNIAAADQAAPCILVCSNDEVLTESLCALVIEEGCVFEVATNAEDARACLAHRHYAALIVDFKLPPRGGLSFARTVREARTAAGTSVMVVTTDTLPDGDGPSPLDVVDWINKPAETERLAEALRAALSRTRPRRPVVLHLDDDRDLLKIVSAALEPEAQIVTATDLPSARALLHDVRPDAVILDLHLEGADGRDLIPFLVDEDGLAIPTVIFSAQDVTEETAAQVDAVLVKARGSIPDLKATLRRILRPRLEEEPAA